MRKIILVDDERTVVETITKIVDWQQCGAVLCETCLNAFEALDAIRRIQPDIVITDIKMPVMDGLELIRQVRKFNTYAEFIILSGYGEFELAKEAMKWGVREFLLKPCSEQDIYKAVQNAAKELSVRKFNIENAQKRKTIHAALIRQTLLTCLQEDYRAFLEDAHFPHLIESGSLYWVSFDQMPRSFSGQGMMEIYQECATESLTFLPLVIQLQQTLGGFYILQKAEGEGESLLEELYAKLLFQLQRSFGISPRDGGFQEVNLRTLMTYMEAEYGAYSGFYYTLGQDWIYREKIRLNTLAGKEEKEETVSLPVEGTLSEEQYHDFTDIIIEHVRQHYADEELNLKWIARELVFLNEDYVSKRFLQRTGFKFTTYLNLTRVEEAKKLLELGSVGSESVAASVGYGNNPKYFAKVFKKYAGCTPRDYKNMDNHTK